MIFSSGSTVAAPPLAPQLVPMIPMEHAAPPGSRPKPPPPLTQLGAEESNDLGSGGGTGDSGSSAWKVELQEMLKELERRYEAKLAAQEANFAAKAASAATWSGGASQGSVEALLKRVAELERIVKDLHSSYAAIAPGKHEKALEAETMARKQAHIGFMQELRGLDSRFEQQRKDLLSQVKSETTACQAYAEARIQDIAQLHREAQSLMDRIPQEIDNRMKAAEARLQATVSKAITDQVRQEIMGPHARAEALMNESALLQQELHAKLDRLPSDVATSMKTAEVHLQAVLKEGVTKEVKEQTMAALAYAEARMQEAAQFQSELHTMLERIPIDLQNAVKASEVRIQGTLSESVMKEAKSTAAQAYAEARMQDSASIHKELHSMMERLPADIERTVKATELRLAQSFLNDAIKKEVHHVAAQAYAEAQMKEAASLHAELHHVSDRLPGDIDRAVKAAELRLKAVISEVVVKEVTRSRSHHGLGQHHHDITAPTTPVPTDRGHGGHFSLADSGAFPAMERGAQIPKPAFSETGVNHVHAALHEALSSLKEGANEIAKQAMREEAAKLLQEAAGHGAESHTGYASASGPPYHTEAQFGSPAAPSGPRFSYPEPSGAPTEFSQVE